jgi:AcrR family transcriptional regulator
MEKNLAAPPAAEPRPRERILAAARELFYRHGILTVGVDAIAEAAGTNKMTLYRHFASKDILIVECLRQLNGEFEATFEKIRAAHSGDPRAQLIAWLRHIGEWKLGAADRGCGLANAAVELSDKDHPARHFIDEQKTRHRERLVRLCREAELVDPELLADKVTLMCEGARVSLQSVGVKGPAGRLVEMLHGLVDDHTPARRSAPKPRPRPPLR